MNGGIRLALTHEHIALHPHRRFARHGPGHGRTAAAKGQRPAVHLAPCPPRSGLGRPKGECPAHAMDPRPGRRRRRQRTPARVAAQPEPGRFRLRQPDQQRGRHPAHRPAAPVPAGRLGAGPARGPGSTHAAVRRLFGGHAGLARAAQSAQHFIGSGPLRHGLASGLLRGQSGHGPFHPLPGAGRSPARQRCQSLLTRPRRDRHRHAGANARRCRGGIPRPVQVFATQSPGPAQLARPSRHPGAWLPGSARLR